MKVGDILTVVEIGSSWNWNTRVKFNNGKKATVDELVVVGDKFKVVRIIRFDKPVIDFELINEDFNEILKS